MIDMWASYDDYLNPDGRIVHSLVRFDLSGLPPGAQINSATLRLYLVASWDYPSRYHTITTYRIGSDWWVNGSQPNYGIMVRGPEYSGIGSSWRAFSTKEGSYPPQLLINYTGSAASAAPTATATSAVPAEFNPQRHDGGGTWWPCTEVGYRAAVNRVRTLIYDTNAHPYSDADNSAHSLLTSSAV
jgi:hypothetical protein